MKAPGRLLDDPSLSAEERALLVAGSTTSPVDYDVDRGLTRFHAGATLLAAGTGAAAARPGAVKALLGKVSLKVALAIGGPVVGAGLVIGGVAALRDEGPASAPHPGAAAKAPGRETASEHAPSRRDEHVERPRELAPSTRSDSATEARAARSAPLSVPRPARRPGPRPSPAVVHLEETDDGAGTGDTTLGGRNEAPALPEPSAAKEAKAVAEREAHPPSSSEGATASAASAIPEMRAIAAAKAMIARDPTAAVAALNAIQRDYPRGFFVEERRALMVLALARAGNRAAARELGAAFLRRYPSGTFSDEIRAATAR